MRRALLVAGALGLWLGCGAPAKPPDLLTRELPSQGDAPPRGDVPLYDDSDPDAGNVLPELPACCVVAFAVPAEPDDLAATFVSGRRVPLARDGGAWVGDVCMPLANTVYFYEVLVPAESDGDGGTFRLERINPAAPSTGGGTIDLLNVFDVGDAGTCAELDAGVHAQRPDAG